MTHFKVGDKVIITEGDFKGERGAIIDKQLRRNPETGGLRLELHVRRIDDTSTGSTPSSRARKSMFPSSGSSRPRTSVVA